MCSWKKDITSEELKLVNKAMEKLRHYIDELENSGTPFEQICNNDKVKYDILGNGFFVFKYVGPSRTQLRILYRFTRQSPKQYELEIHKVYSKKSDQKTQGQYLKDFSAYLTKNNLI
jgi:hypothetical protein